MFYTIYKITNQIDGKIYIGSHKTKDLNDAYMGSGKYLKHAQKKHGIENFTKDILFVFDNPEEMFQKEAELVNEDFIATENTYNIKVGGFGGWDYANSDSFFNVTHTKEHITKTHQKQWNNPAFRDKMKKLSSERLKTMHRKRKQSGDMEKYKTFSGKHHSEESKRRIGEKNSIFTGARNSQFGTCWIWHELIGNKKIKKHLLPDYIEQGWIKKYIPGFKVMLR